MDWNKSEKTILDNKILIDSQRRTLKKYIKEIKVQGVKIRTRVEYLRILRDLGVFIKKPYEEASRDDILSFLAHKQDSVADSTLSSIKVAIKRFYKVIGDGEEYPDNVKRLKTTRANNVLPVKDATDLWSEDEVLEMIKVAGNVRNKAIISSLYESGARADEFLKLKIKSLKFDENGCIFHVTGKTGMRRIRLVNSSIYLQRWLEEHPYKDDIESPLWLRLRGKGIKPLGHNALCNVLERAKNRCKKPLNSKDIYPHLFRHSRITHIAKFLPEYKLKVFAGWSMDSKMSRVYVHLAGKDLDDDIIAINGEQEDKPQKKSALIPKTCPRCNRKNPADSLYCNCGQVLDTKVALEMEDSKDKLLIRLLSDPSIQELLGAEKTKDGKLIIDIK